jgi:biopolymer transport protein ExbD
MTPISRRIRHRQPMQPPKLNLTAMVDVFVVLLIFLLKSYSAEGNILTFNKDLQLPVSTSNLPPQLTLTVTVTQEGIYVEDKKVESIKAVQEAQDLLIQPLAQELTYQVQRAQFIAGFNPTVKFEGKVTILGDRGLPFSILEKVMYTCSASDFNEISLAVFQK